MAHCVGALVGSQTKKKLFRDERRAECRESLVVCSGGPLECPSRDRADAVRRGSRERALEIDGDVGRWCSGWASGVLGAVDGWLCAPWPLVPGRAGPRKNHFGISEGDSDSLEEY